MREKHRLSRKEAVRLLERACAFESNSHVLTAGQVESAARNLGLSHEALFDAMSAEMDRGWRTVLLGRPSFYARVELGGPIAQSRLVETMEAAGFGRGESREVGDRITWQRHAAHESVHVDTDGATVLKLTAHRSVVLGFVPWLGWGAGVACMALTPVVWPNLELSAAAFALAAAVGFSTARAAWNRILARWRGNVAHCTSRLQAELQRV